MLPAYHRAHAVQQGEYVGEIGKREYFYVTCIAQRETESAWGVSKLHEFKDGDGNSLIWFSSKVDSDIPLDESITIKATPKKHTEFNKKKQTRLTRVVRMDESWV